MLIFKDGKMKMMSVGNASVTLILPLRHLNINRERDTVTTWHNGIFSRVSQPHSVQTLVEAHQWTSVPLGRRRSQRNTSPGLLVPLSRAVARCLQGMNYFLNTSARRRDGFIPVGQEENESWRDEGERVDPWRKKRPLAPGRVLGHVLPTISVL